MITLLAALPFLLAVGLLAAGRRGGALAAGIAGAIATLPAAALLQGDATPFAPAALREAAKGAWLAWHAIAVIVGGLVFHRLVELRQPLRRADTPVPSGRQLYTLCFLLGPFAESATGFGVGFVIVLAVLRRGGIDGMASLLFGLYSQMLVPWGAMAAGTTIGAHLAGMPVERMGWLSALLVLPLLFGHLVTFWWLALRRDGRLGLAQCLDDALWTGLLAGALLMANWLVAVDIASLIATGGLLLLRYVRDWQPDRLEMRAAFRAALPYLALCAILIATRTVPTLRQFLTSQAVWQPFADQPAFAWAYNPCLWMVATGLVSAALAVPMARALTTFAEALRTAWRAVAITLAFVVLARLAAGFGLAQHLADRLYEWSGAAAILLVPLLAAAGGFLTSSNTASNGMMLPIQLGLADALARDPGWVAALQNVVGSTFTMLSPTRIAIGVVLVGFTGGEGRVYRSAWPIAAVALALAIIEAVLLPAAPGSPEGLPRAGLPLADFPKGPSPAGPPRP
jgi:lactate permease